METEIARDLWEDERYNKAEAIAQSLGLDTSSEQTLWRDKAMVELNLAILHSFSKAKVTLVDHQTASRQFLIHDQREKRAGRECPAQWSWIVPASGGSTTPAWHHEMRDFFLSPSYHYAADKWAVIDADLLISGEFPTGHATRDERILILYGSETGTAESYARQTARRLSQYQPLVMALDDYNVAHLSDEQFVLVVTSTFGNGGLPGNAKKFYESIRVQPAGAFEGLNFSVMALGSTIYPHFCAAGAMIDRELARVGGNRVVAMHQGDEIKGQAETFRQWLGLIAQLLGEDPATGNASQIDDTQFVVSFLEQDIHDGYLNGQRSSSGISVPVLTNRELLNEVVPGSRSTRFLTFDISGTDLTYEPGDHVAIYPHNPPGLVERLCRRLAISTTAWFTTQLTNQDGILIENEYTYLQPTSVWQALAEDFDLSLREPLNELVDLLYKTAVSANDRNLLTTWQRTLKQDDQQDPYRALKKYLADHFMNIVDLLDAFPSCQVRFDQLLPLLPRQKPRLYSIASSPLAYPEQIHITVGLVQITTDSGQTRQGLCSNYLTNLDPRQGARVRLAVRSSDFQPPRDPQAPMLMIGPGTGISPFIGFLQHREAQFNNANPVQYCPVVGPIRSADKIQPPGYARLFFGCHNQNDFLYQRELEAWQNSAVLTRLDVAFSRLGEEKVYVQHLLDKYSLEIWDLLTSPNCHLYLCGDAKMAEGVSEVLMDIAKIAGGLSYTEAVDFFQTMQQENRFVMDVWGVVLHFRKTIAEAQKAHDRLEERWLSLLTTT